MVCAWRERDNNAVAFQHTAPDQFSACDADRCGLSGELIQVGLINAEFDFRHQNQA